MEDKSNKLALDRIRVTLGTEYGKQIQNYFGDSQQALKFLSSVTSAIQRTPELLECTPDSLINSFMIMAQFGFMPSALSGEAYVLPYRDKRAGDKVAQFQLGYQGLLTLLYRAGAKSVVAEIVRKNDTFSIRNGSVSHEIDPFKTREERGVPMGSYAIITTQTGGKVEKFMRKDEILAMAKRFSKSYGTSFSPWNEENDPEGWMWRKTVLKQAAKLAPKNETLNLAISEDNKDSVIADRLEEAKGLSGSMTMGSLVETTKKVAKPETTHEEKTDSDGTEEIADAPKDYEVGGETE